MTLWQLLLASWLAIDVAFVALAARMGRIRHEATIRRMATDATIADLERALAQTPAT